MLNNFLHQAMSAQAIGGFFIALAVAASVLTVFMPMMSADTLDKRMKSVGVERERIRQRERERLAQQQSRKAVRHEQKAFMKSIVDNLSLEKWLGIEQSKQKLWMAGYRGPAAETALIFFRLVAPIVFFIAAAVYVFGISKMQQPPIVKVGMVMAALYAGIKAPEVFLRNAAEKRQQSMNRAYPNALDLLLICTESGMSIEHAFRKVAQEIGVESVPLAEEMTLTTAELSYLPDRRQAYENLTVRTGLPAMKSLATVLTQAERYGTPLGAALRVLAQESRDQRMNDAEKKAAALPPKLTVPMILFFIPVLFAVIMSPAIIQIYKYD